MIANGYLIFPKSLWGMYRLTDHFITVDTDTVKFRYHLILQAIFVKGECKKLRIVPFCRLLEEPAETVPLPSQLAKANDVAAVMFSSVDAAGVLCYSDTRELPKGSQLTNAGLKTCAMNFG